MLNNTARPAGFAASRTFGPEGASAPIWCQLMGATIYALWAFGGTFVVFWVVNKVKSIRVPPESEEEGLDVPEFGMQGYPEDAVVHSY